ncbi:MAG: hypothetical protein KC431_14830, partial [Myxococcales bacterium]|nr:hypothetical protein [Myxococcales bacterium]
MPIKLTPTTPDWHEQIDAATAGEHFQLSEGRFTLTRPLVVSTPGVRISGAGRGVTTAVTGKETLLHKDYAGPAVAFVPKHASLLSPVIKRDGRPWMRLGLCSEVPYSVPLQDSGVCSFRDGRTVILELFVDALKADNLGIGVPLWVAGNQNRYGYEEWKYEHAETGFGIYQRWTWGLYFIQQAGGIVLRFMVPRPENPLDLPHLVDSAPLPVNAAGETGRHHVVAVFQADGPRRGLELYVDGVGYLGATGASLSPMSLDLMDDCVLGVQPESWMGSWPPPKASGFMRGATLRVGAALPAEAGFAPPG